MLGAVLIVAQWLEVIMIWGEEALERQERGRVGQE